MSLGEAFSGVLALLCLMGTGFLLGRLKLFPESLDGPVSTICLKAAIPCTLFGSCLNYLKAETLADMGLLLLLPPVSMVLAWLAALGAARLLRIKPNQTGAFCMAFALSNSIFIGLPLCQSFFGEAALPYVTLFFPANTLLFWTVGVAALARDGGQAYAFHWKSLGKVFSPPLIGAAAGAVCALGNVPLPPFLLTASGYLGGLTAPLSLLLTGAILSRMGRTAFRLGRRGWAALLGRFGIVPGIMLGLCVLARGLGWMDIPDGPLVMSVFTLEAGMPVMNQALIMARENNADHAWMAQMLAVSCMLGMGILPLWAALVSRL